MSQDPLLSGMRNRSPQIPTRRSFFRWRELGGIDGRQIVQQTTCVTQSQSAPKKKQVVLETKHHHFSKLIIFFMTIILSKLEVVSFSSGLTRTSFCRINKFFNEVYQEPQANCSAQQDGQVFVLHKPCLSQLERKYVRETRTF